MRRFVRPLVMTMCIGYLVAVSPDNFGVVSDSTRLRAAGYDRPVGDTGQSRSVVLAKRGMVATSQPLAAQAGLDVLKEGGTAADAAVAVSAMVTAAAAKSVREDGMTAVYSTPDQVRQACLTLEDLVPPRAPPAAA